MAALRLSPLETGWASCIWKRMRKLLLRQSTVKGQRFFFQCCHFLMNVSLWCSLSKLWALSLTLHLLGGCKILTFHTCEASSLSCHLVSEPCIKYVLSFIEFPAFWRNALWTVFFALYLLVSICTKTWSQTRCTELAVAVSENWVD